MLCKLLDRHTLQLLAYLQVPIQALAWTKSRRSYPMVKLFRVGHYILGFLKKKTIATVPCNVFAVTR